MKFIFQVQTSASPRSPDSSLSVQGTERLHDVVSFVMKVLLNLRLSVVPWERTKTSGYFTEKSEDISPSNWLVSCCHNRFLKTVENYVQFYKT
jgi:hypothetical protein